jgi:lysophospholipase L1-like esterase
MLPMVRWPRQRPWGLAALLTAALAAAPAHADAPQRIVFVGDSITDGNTYPLLIRQALAEADRPVPVCIDAGVASDTARDMRKRLGRDVLVHQPTLVTLSAGVNDGLRNVSPADYEADVTAIAEALREKHIPLVLLTTTVLGPKHAAAEKRLAEYNAILHRLAKRYDCRVAEVFDAMSTARAAGRKLLEEDQVHLSFEGYRVMTRAVLDALGHPKVAVPAELKVELRPGVVREWQVRPTTKKEVPLNEQAVAALKPDGGWKTYTLPEKGPAAHWWFEQERRRGFALSLDKLVGPGKGYQAMASLQAEKPRSVFFNTGAQLQTVWLNGKRIYQNTGWTGWHAGKERVPARLQAGRNVIVIETGPAFFLSVTDDNRW